MTQQPRVTLRINATLYTELVAIAEARDCTLQQALDFYLERVRQQARDEAAQLQLPAMPRPKRTPRPRKRPKPAAAVNLDQAVAESIAGPVVDAAGPKPKKQRVRHSWPWHVQSSRVKVCGKCGQAVERGAWKQHEESRCPGRKT